MTILLIRLVKNALDMVINQYILFAFLKSKVTIQNLRKIHLLYNSNTVISNKVLENIKQ